MRRSIHKSRRDPALTRNNASAFRAHVYLTLITMALTTAFQTWMDQQDKLETAGNETGIRKSRQKFKQENGSKLIRKSSGVTSCIVNMVGGIWPANQAPFAF